MTIHASKNSVAGQIEGRPLNMIRSIASTPMGLVAKQLRGYMASAAKDGKDVRPEDHAMRFYLLEHASGTIRAKYGAYDVLPVGELKIMEYYNEQSLKMATRAYYYLLLICWREMRHCRTKEATFPQAGVHAGAAATMMADFLYRASDTQDTEAIASKWDNSAITLGQLTKALVYGYRKGKWGSAYGGPKWAVVTECLDSFVWGKTSAAMMLDTVWTLAHNTAPIFNKGMLYSDQDKSTLLEILDVQRAGQIPQYVRTAKNRSYRGAPYLSQDFLKKVIDMGSVLGGEFADKSDVNWPTVKALGAKGNYAAYATKLAQKEPAVQDVLTAKSILDAKKQFMSEPMKTTPFAGPVVKKLSPGVTVTIGRLPKTQEAVAA